MSTSTPEFNRLIASLDGDEELLAGIAAQVAGYYRSYAGQLRLLLDDNNCQGLQKIAHKLKATWSMYADEYADAPEQLEAALRMKDTGAIHRLTEILIRELQTVSDRLNRWLENRSNHTP